MRKPRTSRSREARYIDVHAALVSGGYSEATLLELAARADNGFDLNDFGRVLAAVDDRPDSSFGDYGLDHAEIRAAGRDARVE
ncbi:MAG: hypothetical protein ACR2G2_03550 [Pseudonocardia sp.]